MLILPTWDLNPVSHVRKLERLPLDHLGSNVFIEKVLISKILVILTNTPTMQKSIHLLEQYYYCIDMIKLSMQHHQVYIQMIDQIISFYRGRFENLT